MRLLKVINSTFPIQQQPVIVPIASASRTTEGILTSAGESTYFSYKVKHSAIYVVGCILFVKIGTLHSGHDS